MALHELSLGKSVAVADEAAGFSNNAHGYHAFDLAKKVLRKRGPRKRR